jgi:AmpE protein
MNFLVVLACLTINYLWLKDVDRFDDGWFFKFRCKVENRAQSNESTSRLWLFNLLLIYLFPLSVLLAALLVLEDVAFGAPLMILHGLVVLIALDRKQPGKLTTEFVGHWQSGGMVEAKKYLEDEFESAELDAAEGKEGLADFFSKQLIHRCFERMFVMFFWYMLAGPLAVAFSYISYQLQDSHGPTEDAAMIKIVDVFIGVLEWVPMRLLALTFSLAGNFVLCFDRLKRNFWDFSLDSDNGELLYAYSSSALSGVAADFVDETGFEAGSSSPISKEIFRIRALQALLERSQAIWLATLGLITIFAI